MRDRQRNSDGYPERDSEGYTENNFSSSSSRGADCFIVSQTAEDEFSFLDASRLIFVQQIKERSLERRGVDCRGKEFIVSIFRDIGRKMVADQFLPIP